MVEEVILDFRRDFTALWTHKLSNIPQLTAKVPILPCPFVSVKANNWPVVSSKLVCALIGRNMSQFHPINSKYYGCQDDLGTFKVGYFISSNVVNSFHSSKTPTFNLSSCIRTKS